MFEFIKDFARKQALKKNASKEPTGITPMRRSTTSHRQECFIPTTWRNESVETLTTIVVLRLKSNSRNETMGSDPGVSKSAFHLPLST